MQIICRWLFTVVLYRCRYSIAVVMAIYSETNCHTHEYSPVHLHCRDGLFQGVMPFNVICTRTWTGCSRLALAVVWLYKVLSILFGGGRLMSCHSFTQQALNVLGCSRSPQCGITSTQCGNNLCWSLLNEKTNMLICCQSSGKSVVDECWPVGASDSLDTLWHCIATPKLQLRSMQLPLDQLLLSVDSPCSTVRSAVDQERAANAMHSFHALLQVLSQW